MMLGMCFALGYLDPSLGQTLKLDSSIAALP